MDGMSMQLLKLIAVEISIPLAHVFNLSLKNGIFPEALKKSRTVSIFPSCVTIAGPFLYKTR